MFKVVVTRLDECGQETRPKTIYKNAKKEKAQEYIDDHEQDFSDDPAIYAVYIMEC